jgi:hypothetical protein
MRKKIYGNYSELSTHSETDMGDMSLTNATQLQIKTSGLKFGIPHLLFPEPSPHTSDLSQDYYSLHFAFTNQRTTILQYLLVRTYCDSFVGWNM